MADKPWQGRFAEKTDRGVEAFTASIDIDKRLYPYDIEGSIAHCTMLAETSIITADDAAALCKGLEKIKGDLDRGEFEFDDRLEDIHMHIEARLLEEVGTVADKLHTARSRNDQVVLDVRMYLRDETGHVLEALTLMRGVLVKMARDHIEVIMPGYTHLQRAQPVLFSHHLMAYYEMLSRDQDRFRDGLKRIDVMPLGSAALAGTTFPIDRELTANLLNFSEISANSIDSVSDRDFIVEFLSAASLSMIHLSRLSEELVLWSSAEFGFIELPDSFATGSSIMPQKKNPDVAELVRGKTGRVFGDLIALLTLMKSLPLSYNRDLQEDKAPLFNTVDTLLASLDIYARMLPALKINAPAMHRAASKGYLSATDLADYLVTKGLPFRQAHGCVGAAVSYAIEKGKELDELSLDVLQSFSSLIDADVFDILTVDQMIQRRVSHGGTAKANVLAAIEKADNALKKPYGKDPDR